MAGSRARYCGGCGQRFGENLLTVRAFLAEALDEVLGLNGRLPRTLASLLVRPGFLTSEYRAGRISRYIRPFRLYLSCSVIFFLALSISIRFDGDGIRAASEMMRQQREAATTAPGAGQAAGGDTAEGTEGDAEVETQAVTGAGTVAANDADPKSATGSVRVRPPLAPIKVRVGKDDGVLGRFLGPFVESASTDPATSLRLLTDRLVRDAPKAVFILLPVFALFLKVLYIRRRRLFVEHLVFVLHVHAFAFLLATLLLLVPSTWPTWFVWLCFPVYLLWAMLRFYEQSFSKTLVKLFLFGWMYMICGIITMLTAVVLAAVTL